MANKKKRTKKYKGTESVQTPAAIKITAPDRSKPGQWYYENRQRLATRMFQLGLVLIVGGAVYYIIF